MLQYLISPDQTGYVPNRSLHDNLLFLALAYETKGPDKFVRLFLDFSKAFDKLDHSFIDLALQKFSFGTNFRLRIKRLFHGAQSQVLINGTLSNPFPILSGVRQGDPISGILVILH